MNRVGPIGRGRGGDPETLGIAAIGWLADRPDDLRHFLDATGIDPASIRNFATDPGFTMGVLDFLMDHERLLVAFANSQGMSAEQVAAARRGLGDHAEMFT
jgi:hypothetical protein